MSKTKVLWEEEVMCPHCDKKISVKKEREVLEEAVKAEYEDTVVAEKSTQKTLVDDFGTPVEKNKYGEQNED